MFYLPDEEKELGQALHAPYRGSPTLPSPLTSPPSLVYIAVAYYVMGHTIFLEDGIEQNNTISGNLVVWTRKRWGARREKKRMIIKSPRALNHST